MKIYTKTGDKGKTNIIGGRVFKNDARVEAYGTIDELNCFVGDAITEAQEVENKDISKLLEDLQQDIFDCASDLAVKDPSKVEAKLKEAEIGKLEKAIDLYDSETNPIEYFIMPGGTKLSAKIHICRTVARRAERLIVTLALLDEPVPEIVRIYVNRLSDLFFTLARVANKRADVSDVFYIRSNKVFTNNS